MTAPFRPTLYVDAAVLHGFDPRDLWFEVHRSGQRPGVTEHPPACAVRVTHQPTGLQAVCADHPTSTRINRDGALVALRALLDGAQQ